MRARGNYYNSLTAAGWRVSSAGESLSLRAGVQILPHFRRYGRMVDAVAHSSSGPGRRPLKAEITGSSPVCATNRLDREPWR